MKFYSLAIAALCISNTEAIKVEEKSTTQMTAQAFQQQMESLTNRMEEDQKELEKMKNLWGSIKSLF